VSSAYFVARLIMLCVVLIVIDQLLLEWSKLQLRKYQSTRIGANMYAHTEILVKMPLCVKIHLYVIWL
jgi:hypothetical protein